MTTFVRKVNAESWLEYGRGAEKTRTGYREKTEEGPVPRYGSSHNHESPGHRLPRIDISDQVWFANDQVGVRFIEEIDVDYAAIDATAALLTAAS